MKRKLIIFLTAITSVLSSMSLSFAASAVETAQNVTIEGTTTATAINSDTEDVNAENEKQKQIEEVYRFLEENGYSVGDLINAAQTTSSTKQPSKTATTTAAVNVKPEEPNGYLVEKVDKSPSNRDFITVTTRDGHIFYIVIDYEDENKKVYFLNTVDTADLARLLSDGNTGTAVKENAKKDEPETKTTESVKKTDTKETAKKGNNNLVLYIIGIFIIIAIVFFARKKITGNKKHYDDDSEYSDQDNEFTEEEPEEFTNDD